MLETQVRRLLADPRSESLVNTFAFQWLKMRALEEIDPDPIIFPNFDDSLRGHSGARWSCLLAASSAKIVRFSTC